LRPTLIRDIIMKKTLFIVCAALTLCDASICGQKAVPQEVSFTYDNAGNRISRSVINVKINPKDNSEEPKSGSNEPDIQVYPNPIRDELTIEIWEGNDEENYRFLMFDMSGKMVKESKQQGNGKYPVDMSAFINGTYILVINYEEGKREFKITKSEL